MHLDGKEISELYVDYFFWKQGIGAQLLEFAKEKYEIYLMTDGSHILCNEKCYYGNIICVNKVRSRL